MLTASTVAGLALAGAGITIAGLAGALFYIVRNYLGVTKTAVPVALEEPAAVQRPWEVNLQVLATQITTLNDRFERLKRDCDDEIATSRRAYQASHTALSRAKKLAESSESEPDEDEDVRGDDAPAGRGQGVLPLRGRVAEAPPAQTMNDRFQLLKQATIQEAMSGIR